MKKLALSAILGASLMISSSAFALTAMNDAGMKSATGQAGVSIAIDNVKIEQYVGSTTYTDTSGAYGAGDSGAIVIGSKHTVKEFLALTDATDFATDFNAAAGVAATATWRKAAALTIDVGTCKVLSAGLNANAADAALTVASMTAMGLTTDEIMATMGAKGTATDDIVAGVIIGLPTLLISTTADSYDVGVSKTGALNNGAKYIQISKGASAMAILGGTVEIAAH